MSLPILLIDDNPDACATAAKLLWSCGYQAEVAYDGNHAMRLIDAKPFSVAIIDYQLPDGDGLTLFRRMRKIHPCLCGVLLTGFASPELEAAAHEAGINHVLAKPPDYAELIPLIDEFVGVM